MSDPIYLDYNATTPPADEVIEAMLPALRDGWGNPSSAHAYGRRARAAIDRARVQVASLLGCSPAEIVFTSGGTESDNAAIVGVAEARADDGRHIVTSTIEHPAVESACAYLERRGWSVTRVGVDARGLVDAEAVEAALRPDTTLVSIMHAHNETGVIQPVAAISRLVRPRGIVLHTDAAQSVGKLAVDVDELGVDLLTVAGHKFYGPPGVGALYLREGTAFSSFLRGGGHESGRRAGTETVPQIVGLGAACELAENELPRRTERMLELRWRLERGLRERIPELVVHGDGVERLPNTLYLSIPGLDANRLLERLPEVAMATGSACHAGETHVPQVLRSMSVDEAVAMGSLRLTVGRPTTTDEVDRAAERIAAVARELGN
jgi:cysteine desulfurase